MEINVLEGDIVVEPANETTEDVITGEGQEGADDETDLH